MLRVRAMVPSSYAEERVFTSPPHSTVWRTSRRSRETCANEPVANFSIAARRHSGRFYMMPTMSQRINCVPPTASASPALWRSFGRPDVLFRGGRRNRDVHRSSRSIRSTSTSCFPTVRKREPASSGARAKCWQMLHCLLRSKAFARSVSLPTALRSERSASLRRRTGSKARPRSKRRTGEYRSTRPGTRSGRGRGFATVSATGTSPRRARSSTATSKSVALALRTSSLFPAKVRSQPPKGS